MKMGYFHSVSKRTPTRFWINNVTRREAELAIAAGAEGCTQNPSYVWKMINHPEEREYTLSFIDAFIRETPNDDEVLVRTQRALVAQIAKTFMPLYEATGGRIGYVSVQGDPFDESYDTIVRQGLYNREAGPNIMVKVPVVVEGLRAIRTLLDSGAPINATEVFAVRQAMDVAELYHEYASKRRDAPVVYFSHITGIYDEYLEKLAEREKLDISADALWQAGIVIAKKAYALAKGTCPTLGFIGGGARGTRHFTEMVGADAAITINWKGMADKLIEMAPPVVDRFCAPTADAVLDELLSKVEDFRRGYMTDGIEPHDYEEFGPVELFRDSFTEAWGHARQFVSTRRASRQ